MRQPYLLFLFIVIFSCNQGKSLNSNGRTIDQKNLKNEVIRSHKFLDCMYKDPYFPPFLVDKCKTILLELCWNIEDQKPDNLQKLYHLTQASTERINDLQDEFFENGSEIETAARECLGADFNTIAKTYGFEADLEELIATR